MVAMFSILLIDSYFIMVLANNLHELRPFVEDPNSGPRVQPSIVLLMKILFHDENYTSENILILQRLAKNAKLLGTPQVCIFFTVLSA